MSQRSPPAWLRSSPPLDRLGVLRVPEFRNTDSREHISPETDGKPECQSISSQ